MDTATIIGIASGVVLVFGAIALRPGALFFIDLSSMMIVFGGTIGSTLINFPAKDVLSVFKVLKKVFTSHKATYDETISHLVSRSNIRDPLAVLEHAIQVTSDAIASKGKDEPQRISTVLYCCLSIVQVGYAADFNLDHNLTLSFLVLSYPALPCP